MAAEESAAKRSRVELRPDRGTIHGGGDSSAGVVSEEAWLEARKALLAREKEFSKMKDEMAKLRREMPRHLVKEDYEFTREDGSKVRLSELFGDEHDSLIVVHFMFDPAWERGCKSCSLWGDGYDGIMAHLNRKAAFTCVSMAPPEKIAEFKAFKGWSFPWVSSGGNSFNADYGVHFTPEEIEAKHKKFNYGRSFPASEAPGYSIFRKEADGTVTHTYSTYGRGMELMSAVWGFLDLLPRGRDESHNMDWLDHKQFYDKK